MKIEFIKAKLSDIEEMQRLVQPEVESGVILVRSSDEIATNIRSYILAKNGDELVGFCALHIHAASLAEIRSLIVNESYRGQGIGANLISKAVDEARFFNIQKIRRYLRQIYSL